MCKIISIASYKGGVGKTTSTINIAASLAMQGYKVLAVDNDPQSSLTKWLSVEKATNITLPHLLLELIDNDAGYLDKTPIENSIIKFNDFFILPCSPKMSSVESLMVMAVKREYLLKSILETIKINYDFILIDCPPSLGIFLLNALTASNSVIIPIEAYAAAIDGLPDILNNIAFVKKNLNPDIFIEGMILTKYQSRTNLCKSIQEIVCEHFGGRIHVYDEPIKQSINVAKMPAEHRSVFEYDPNGNAALVYEIIAKEVSRCQSKI